ncbi:glucosaminidase domain-containing protein [Paenibacillus sp. GSMTC-2017]|uniref:glucosaminidase domain-containing protein n=1 Tax=Paenibacillus sp. GSMTC-2017 TaxID=2794350 RepID=UPI0018D7AAC0|nr:glucosaminidase domain-containing protein [Paenibacillus sp. GSMTC-2017]MBH5317740.1 glucosaminidase domain-containing protein [Paenibacillus sp. GSMTC-2017]
MPTDSAYVLTPTDVKNIRTYVQSKYATMPHDKRAEIVADAVTRIIHKQLPHFTVDVKRQLTSTLIRTTVLEHQRPVSADDIFLLCMKLDQSDESIALPLREWTRKQEARLNRKSESATIEATNAKASSSAEIIPLRLPYASDQLIKWNIHKKFYLFSTLSIFIVVVTLMFGWSLTNDINNKDSQMPIAQNANQETVAPVTSKNALPPELKYEHVDRDKLIAFLKERNSILAEPKYMDAILKTAKEFDIHPAFMFAITGQEQGFVPRTHKKAKEIANNPFNVFHSWEEFNTTIDQSSQIAARTITRLSKDKPAETDPFTWINREYAEDPNWSNGVRSIFTMIMNEIELTQEGK